MPKTMGSSSRAPKKGVESVPEVIVALPLLKLMIASHLEAMRRFEVDMILGELCQVSSTG